MTGYTVDGGVECNITYLSLSSNENVSKLEISRGPCVDDGVSGDLSAENLANGAEKARANNGVVLGKDAERHVLVDDLRSERTKVFKSVNVLGIAKNRVGQRTRLSARDLVSLVEERTNVVVLHQDGVEVLGESLAASFEDRDGGLDDGNLLSGDSLLLLLYAHKS